MNRKTARMTSGLAATLVAATAAAVTVLAVSASATAAPTAVTEHFHAKSASAPLLLNKTTFVAADSDVRKGKQIGSDVLYCTGSGTDTGTTHCHVAFAQKGGILYASFAMTDTGVLTGTVAGGTGAFTHAKGTLAGQAASPKDVKITLHYKK